VDKAKDKQRNRLLDGVKIAVGLFFMVFVVNALRTESWQELIVQLSVLWQGGQRGYLLSVVFIWPVLMIIDAFKWQILLRGEHHIRFLTALRAVLSGKTAGVLTPAMLGDFAGRLHYLPEAMHLRASWATLYAGFLQQVILWCCALIVLPYWLVHRSLIDVDDWWWALYVLPVAGLLLLLLHRLPLVLKVLLRFRWMPHSWKDADWLERFGSKRVFWVAILSLMRLGLNAFQLVLLWWFFNLELTLELGFVLALMIFGMQGLMPGFLLTDLGIRGGIALFMLSPYADFAWQQLFPSYLLWLLNVIFAAVLGWISLWFVKKSGKEQFQE
jgi:hypothetical protein